MKRTARSRVGLPFGSAFASVACLAIFVHVRPSRRCSCGCGSDRSGHACGLLVIRCVAERREPGLVRHSCGDRKTCDSPSSSTTNSASPSGTPSLSRRCSLASLTVGAVTVIHSIVTSSSFAAATASCPLVWSANCSHPRPVSSSLSPWIESPSCVRARAGVAVRPCSPGPRDPANCRHRWSPWTPVAGLSGFGFSAGLVFLRSCEFGLERGLHLILLRVDRPRDVGLLADAERVRCRPVHAEAEGEEERPDTGQERQILQNRLLLGENGRLVTVVAR